MATGFRQACGTLVFPSLFGFLGLLLSSCGTPVPEPVSLTGIAFFSMPWEVKVARLPASKSLPVLQAELQQTLDNANRVLSTYQPDTELMRFNAAPVGQPFHATPMLFHALTTARQVSQATGGVYDVTVGPLVNLWGFGPQAVPDRVPLSSAILAAQRRVGWQYLGLNPDELIVIRQRDIEVDLSSIGEGVGVDALVDVLEKTGVHDYMVSVAGTLRVSGNKPDGSAWQIAVEKPDGSGLPQQRLRLSGQVAVSTSGAYRNYHEIDGVRYSHTLDPRTGRPISHKGVSVSVVMPDRLAAQADGWATALNVLGPEEGFLLAVRMKIPAYYLVKTSTGFAEKVTPAFKPFLGRSNP